MSASKGNAPNRDAAQAIAAAVATRLALPPVRKPSRTFKGKIVLFGTRRENRPGTLGIEAMSPDGTGLETILLLGKDQGMVGGRECPDGTRLAFDVREVQVRRTPRSGCSRRKASGSRLPTTPMSRPSHRTGRGWPFTV